MTSDLRHGYSAGLVAIINATDSSTVPATFAKHCVANRVSVAELSREFGVSRTTIYAWFKGTMVPHPRHQDAMVAYMARV